MKSTWVWLAVVLACAGCGGDDSTTGPGPSSIPPPPPVVQPLVVIDATGQTASGYEMLVNTDRGRTEWLTKLPDSLQAAYPSGQAWGYIAAVLAGNPAPGSRLARDLTSYRTLQVQLRGAVGGEAVEIGIKDSTDPDDGNETKKTVSLTSSWQTFTFPLTDFTTADRARVYLLFELVFNGAPARSVFVRDVRYMP